jgi:16S rRNA G966 N2-methylase RsmD
MNLLNDYSLLKKDSEGLWSLTHKKEADKISEIIFDIIGFHSTILDATAGIGGNTISFCNYFKKVVAIEKNTERYNMLIDNVKISHFTNLEIINNTCIPYLNNKYDVYFFDPPWGGHDYKMHNELTLTLDNISLVNIINLIKIKHNKLCVFKLPRNYNMKEFTEYDYKLYNIHNYILMLI